MPISWVLFTQIKIVSLNEGPITLPSIVNFYFDTFTRTVFANSRKDLRQEGVLINQTITFFNYYLSWYD